VNPSEEDLKKVNTDKSHQFNLEAARESVILAKNDENVLPLNKEKPTTIFVTGPTSAELRVLNGAWSYSW
jgi:beta-glucosidase